MCDACKDSSQYPEKYYYGFLGGLHLCRLSAGRQIMTEPWIEVKIPRNSCTYRTAARGWTLVWARLAQTQTRQTLAEGDKQNILDAPVNEETCTLIRIL